MGVEQAGYVEESIVATVVFDGPADAGKTTNLRCLVSFFGSNRRSEVVTPSETRGVTEWFDWLRLDGGVLAGRHLLYQLLTVPGQERYAKRRRALLELADTVVFVCDSTAAGADAARPRAEALLRHMLEAGPIGRRVIVQANKQDQDDTLTPREVLDRLGLPEETHVIGASALTGEGVRQTAVSAIRAAADAIRQRLDEHGLDQVLRETPTPEALLQRLELVEAPAESALDGTVWALDESPLDSTPTDAPPPRHDAPTSSTITRIPPPAPFLAAADEHPPWPDGDAPSGWIWPGREGRTAVQALDPSSAHRQPTEDPTEWRLYAGAWRLFTSAAHHYRAPQEAQRALGHAARARARLGHLHHPDVTLAVAADDRGAWLWTVVPAWPTVEERMEDAHRQGDDGALALAFEAYARAILQALRLLEAGVVLELAPSLFAITGPTLTYVGDSIAQGTRPRALEAALMAPLEGYPGRSDPAQRYVEALRYGWDHELPESTRQSVELPAQLRTGDG